jgi:hypothetical protein
MPLYSIQGPDGKTYSIEGPEGASKEQIVDAIQYKLSQQPKIRQNKSLLADIGTDIKRGVQELPGAVTGLADIPFGAAFGMTPVSRLATKAGELTGFEPAKWAEAAKQQYSPERQAAEQAIAEAEGVAGTAKAYLQNPRALAGVITEALPATLAGGFAGRAAGTAMKIASPAIRTGLGEGAISSGMLMDTATQGGENQEDVRRKAIAATGAGLFTGAIGAKSAALSRRLGIVDPESIFNLPMAKSLSQAEIDNFLGAANRSLGQRVGLGLVKEGLLEELPQSVQEQMFQNWAEGKPIMENVSKAAVSGTLAGAGMGGGFNAFMRGPRKEEIQAEVERRRVENAKRIQTNLDRMATEAMGGTRESRALEARELQAAQAERDTDLEGYYRLNDEQLRLRQELDAALAKSSADQESNNRILNMATSSQGVKELRAGFNNLFKLESPEEAARVKATLNQLDQKFKQEENYEKDLAKKDPAVYNKLLAFKTTMDAYDLLGINSQTDLYNRSLDELQAARNEHETRMADAKLPKSKQALYTQIADMLDDAIENNAEVKQQREATRLAAEQAAAAKQERAAIMARIDATEREKANAERQAKLEALRTPESRQAYLAQQEAAAAAEQPQAVPEQAWQQPTEVMPSEEDLWRQQQADEAAAFELQEQYAQPEATAVEEEPTGTEAPKAQQALFTATGKPTQAALRGAPVSVGEGATINQRDISGDELSNQQQATRAKATKGAGLRPVDADLGLANIPAAGTKRGAEGKPGALKPELRKAMLEAEAQADDYLARKSLEEDYKEAQLRAEEPNEDYYDPDAFLYSKKAKGEPKVVSAKMREDSTEPTTVERLQNTVKGWFNPVWYRNASKNGWLQIVDGTINESDLPEAIKAANQDAKAVFTPNGKVYLFAGSIPKGNELGVVLHEIGEHKGLENLIGKDKVVQLANRIRNMAEGKGKDAEIAKRALAMAEGEKAGDKELIAYFTEVAVNNYGMKPGGKNKPEFGKAIGWLQDLWNSLSKALAALHFNPEAIKGQDVVDLLYGAARLEMGENRPAQAEAAAEDADVMASRIQQLSPEESRMLEDMGVKPFRVKGKETVREQVVDLMGGPMTFRDWMDRVGVKMVGPLYAIHRKMTQAYGPDSFYNKETKKFHGHLAAQHSLNSMYFASGAVREGTMEIDPETGAPIIVAKDDNMPKLVGDYDALRKAIEADGNSPAMSYQLASFAILADRYKQLQKMGQKTHAEFPEASYKLGKDIQAKYANEFNAWRETWNNIRQNKRQGLVASGLYTPKEVDTLLDRLEYVPLYRIKDSEGMDAVFMRNLLSANFEQHLQFGTEGYDVADVMGNILKNEMWLYKRIMHNNTTNLLVDDLEQMEKDFGPDFGGHYVPAVQKDNDNVIKFLRDGEVKYFKVNNSNDMAIFESVPVINNTAMRIGNIIGATLRRGITVTPSFWYRQAWQDAERAWMQGGSKQSFLKSVGTNVQQQLANVSKESPLAAEMRKMGIVGQVDFQDSFDHWMNNILGRTDDGWMGKANKWIEKAERLAQNSDLAARASVYKAALDDGYSKQEAALKAQMMINYNHKGTSSFLRYMLATVPFVNAKIQSDWRLVDALKGNIPGVSKDQAKQLLMMKVAKFAAFTALYAMARSGDDDYEDASDETRDRNFLIGGIKVPVSPEYLALKAAIEHSYRTMSDQEFETPEKFRHAMASGAMNLVTSPTDIMPSLVKPMIENTTNYSFFTGRPLVGINLMNKDTNMQYVKGQTSELAKLMSDVGQAILGNDMNVSPIKIDNFIRGFFGSMGQDVLFTSNMIADGLSDVERPAAKLNQLPEIGAMFYDPQGSQRKGDYYQLRDKVEAKYNTFLDLRKTNPERAREYREENKELIRLMPALNAIGNQLENLRARKNRIIESSQMNADEKRDALDKLAEQEKRIVGSRVQQLRARLE